MISKSVNHGYRGSVQIAIKYQILGILKLEERLDLLSFISLIALKFEKNHLCD